jgi:hypothetical protein
MRLKTVVSVATLAGFLATVSIVSGCGTDVPVTPAPAPTPVPTKELPKEAKKGGGPTSSGNMKRNPGADPLAR